MSSCGERIDSPARLHPPVEFSNKINSGWKRRNLAGSADKPDFGLIFFADPAETLVPRGFRKSGLRKILFSKNLDIKILRTDSLAGDLSRWADRHCLDHDCAI
jgi:hypothetical protein